MTAVVTETTTAIGSFEEAETVYRLGLAGTFGGLNGWTFLGDGVYRNAWLAPSGTVYKVPHTNTPFSGYEDFGWQSNRAEYENACLYSDRDWCPPVNIYNVNGDPVIAMPYYEPYYEAADRNLSAEGKAALREAAELIGDMHHENFSVVEGRPIVIDVAGVRWATKCRSGSSCSCASCN
jgi:hypothetical protein